MKQSPSGCVQIITDLDGPKTYGSVSRTLHKRFPSESLLVGTMRQQGSVAEPFWYGSGSGNPCLWLMDPDPAIFVIHLKDANIKLICFKKFICLVLFEGTFSSFFKEKRQKEVRKQ
jgi:hypothetical protein